LYNAYSIPNGHTRSVSPVDLFPQHDFSTLVLGDLNIHHFVSDPTHLLSGYDQFISSSYFDRVSALLFFLLNTPRVYTRFPFTSNHRPAVLDLSFANSALLPYFSSWNPSLPPTSSDHTSLSIILSTPLLKPPPRGLNWKFTDWDHISPLLTDLTLAAPSALPTPNPLDLWFDDSLAKITHLITSNTPTKHPFSYSKPWWTPELTQLRPIHYHTTRLLRKNQSLPALARAARNTYFKAIQTPKRVHLSQSLANPDAQLVWDARKIAAGRTPDRFPTLENTSSPTEINNTLLQHFFPPRPSPPPPLIFPAFKNVPPISPAEVSSALRKSSNTSAPGPSGIPYSIWKQVHKANEQLLPALFTPLLTHGYHPLAMKKANGIVLDKPGKPDYYTPASFRIIVLLETVSKMLERLSALRLASAARSLGLLHPNQCGSLAGLGCFDAVATLTHEVRLLQAASFKVSTLFLDVKGVFDNVCANKLVNTLARGGVTAYLVAWIKSFLSKRQCRLSFQGAPKVFCPVAVGTPQGSLISPLLFVLYIANLHATIPQGMVISYVDNLTITVGSDSVRSNIRALQYFFGIIQRRGADLGVAFSVPKTELIHWRTPKDRSDVSFAPIVINNMLFPPSQAVRWLGYWLTPTIHSSVHFLRRLALAKASFTSIRQLSAAGKGLSSWCNRKLIFGAILPILTYGWDIFVPDAATLKKLNSFWHMVLRWTTNCFCTTALGALYREASLPPISCICKHRRRSAALHLVCAPSEFNPATTRIPESVPPVTTGVQWTIIVSFSKASSKPCTLLHG